MNTELYEQASLAAERIIESIDVVPKVAVVLGSGLGSLADRVRDRVVLPYREIPNFPAPSVPGHEGNLVVGSVEGARVVYLQGRSHYYEGHELSVVTFPVRVLKCLGIETLVLTAAAGGINCDYRPGDLVALSDHLNLLGENPLRGSNDDRFGPRFPDMSEIYTRRLRSIAGEESERLKIELRSGVYACLPGPCYETPAEIRMLAKLGADVVGMSTVPEAIVARHSGIAVLAFALVTNWAAGISDEAINHEEVLRAGAEAVPRLGGLIEAVVKRLAV